MNTSTEKSSKLGTIASIGGVVVSPGTSAALSRTIIELAGDKDARNNPGAHGRAYTEEHWAKDKVLTEIMEEVKALIQERE